MSYITDYNMGLFILGLLINVGGVGSVSAWVECVKMWRESPGLRGFKRFLVTPRVHKKL